MAYSNAALLEKSVEIAKEHAKSGSTRSVESVLKGVYEELKKLNSDIDQN